MVTFVPTILAAATRCLGAAPAEPRAWGSFGTGQLILVALIVVFTVITVIRGRQRIRARQQEPDESARAKYARLTAEQRQRQDLDQALLQLDQLARQVSALLDTKYAKLEAVLREADRRIEQLSRLLQTSPGPTQLDLTLGAEPPEPGLESDPLRSAHDPRRAGIYRLADEGKSALEIARQVDQPVGEIELILALRRARQAQEPQPVEVKA